MEQAGEKGEEMLKVRVTVEYYLEGKQEKACDLQLYLPTDSDGLVLPQFCDRDVEVLGERLTTDWGNYAGNDERYIRKRIKSSDWVELECKVEGIVKSVVDKLVEVYKSNTKEMSEAPWNKEKEIIFI